MTGAISSGYMNGTPYQDFTVKDGSLFLGMLLMETI